MLVSLVKFLFFLIKTALKIVYNVLKVFKIRLLALWLIVSGVMALSGVYKRIGVEWFWIGVGLCVACTVIAWLLAAGDVAERRRVRRDRKELDERAPEEKKPPQPREERKREHAVKYPRWYDVQGRPNYFFAEYADRYELFYRSQNGAVHVRTDYKDGGSDD